jgi:hypothetical protein
METFTLTEEQLLKIIELARGGANYIEYPDKGLPFGGIDFDFQPEEIITELKRGNIK